MDLEKMKAEFLAKGGKVTVVPEEAGGTRSEKEWREFERTHHKGVRVDGKDHMTAERRSEEYMQRMREENGYYKS